VIFLNFALKIPRDDPTLNDVNSTILKFKSIKIISFVWVSVFILPCLEVHAFFKFSKKPDRSSKVGYLLSQSPPPLRYHEPNPTADRKKLLRLVPKTPTEVLTVEDVQPEVSEFAIVSFEEPENNSSYQIPLDENSLNLPAPETPLPPVDPFIADRLTVPNLNNTDELIKILEQDSSSPTNRNYMGSEFIPPYTIESGNMMIQSKSSYERRVR